MKSVLLFLTTVACAVGYAISPSIAHDEKLNPGAARHGGQYVEYDAHHGIEMVATDSKLIFHITEHRKPVDMTGSTFKAFVQADAETKALMLKPEGSTLTTGLTKPLPKGVKIVLTGKDADGHSLQARFVKE